MDNGLPQITDPTVLKNFILQKQLKLDFLLDPVGGGRAGRQGGWLAGFSSIGLRVCVCGVCVCVCGGGGAEF